MILALEETDDLVIQPFGDGLLGSLTATGMLVVAGAAIAYLLHVTTVRLVRRGWNSPYLVHVVRLARWPARFTTTALGARAGLELSPLTAPILDRASTALIIMVIVGATLTGLRLVHAFQIGAVEVLGLGERTSTRARRRFTQVSVVGRLLDVVIILTGAGGVLMTFDRARAFGASLLASAGVASLVAGVAARSTLGNVLAGVQIAFAEPIKIDDIVVVEEEFGWVEQIKLTHVVVRLWDQRRLVLPTLYFVETPFTNWTKDQSQIIGQVMLHLDPAAPIGPIREKFHALVAEHPAFDQGTAVLQVVEMGERTIKVRGLMTAADPSVLWDLRCDVREGLITWLAATHPEALPDLRLRGRDDERDGG